MTDLRMVIGGLTGVLILSVAIIGVLAWRGVTSPDVLEMVAVGSLTALSGILARPRDTPSPRLGTQEHADNV